MLVISRRKGQRVTIGDEIELVVTELHRSSVKLGIKAPRGYTVLRGEIHASIEKANREAARSSLDGAGPLTEAVVSRDFGLKVTAPARQVSGTGESQTEDASTASANGQGKSPSKPSEKVAREPQVYLRHGAKALSPKPAERPSDAVKSEAT